MKTEKLALSLDELAKEYANAQGAEDYYFYQEKNLAHCQITLKEIRLEFLYYTTGSSKEPISTLTCRVSFDRESPYYFEIQELIDYLDIFDYHCYSFPYIENPKRLKACFDYITDFIEYRYEEILSLKSNNEELIQRKLDEIERVFGYNKELTPKGKAEREQFLGNIFNHYSRFLAGRYTEEGAYLDFVEGRFDSSLKKYEAIKEKTGYEEKLVSFISERYAPYKAVPDECASITEVEQYKKSSRKSFIILVAVSVVSCCFLFFLLQLIVNMGYIGTTKFVALANPFKSAVLGIIPGALGAIVFRRKLEPLLKFNKKEAYEFYELLNTSDGIKTPKIIISAAIIISMLVFLGTCRPSLAVYEGHFNYDSGESVFTHYEKYSIHDVKKLILIEGYYEDNDYTKYVEHPTYAFLLNGKKIIPLDNLHLTKKDEKKLISILYPGMEGYKIKNYVSVEEI